MFDCVTKAGCDTAPLRRDPPGWVGYLMSFIGQECQQNTETRRDRLLMGSEETRGLLIEYVHAKHPSGYALSILFGYYR